ncbi:FAD-dependent monooxygenase [Pseudochelatococcus contaminans]|uniref:2-polyprenyl-6-methoxyphenol hydroxylase-like FAD-dependent oxidoreductase n=1 Tax=Pseudochelatococcus contaminans TaxID=1538103 RepID=A0A7W6EI56_9HYPH|nr:FAD-dependent monooxygenase [Pseudochelatococcus contaminans]MBB3810382.1 2-polyprenyl-6-methoxyphenol hydroxylase-like FAD-dependent oxidoreductase [Pseudochelatococcus contaminans]
MKIAIAGAGIGGLTAALCLHEKGHEVRVFEAVETLQPLGVGINLMPHASGVLRGLGLADALDEMAIRTRAIEYRTRFGHLIQSDPRSVEAGFEHPQYSIHRGELQFLLLDTVRSRLGHETVTAGKAIASFSQDDYGVRATFADGTFHDADLLIGADGFRSQVRRQLHPDEGPAHYEGTMMWRGANLQAPFADGRTMFIAGDHNVKFVCYPISGRAAREDQALINWVAEVRHDQPRAADDADWTREGDRDFIAEFLGFRMPDIDIPALLGNTQHITQYPMIDRDPLPWWTQGRVTLLGDAAHPMYPIGANGASQAIIDAQALADALATQPGPEGLLAYEATRLPVTTNVVLNNRKSGPERVLDIAAARVKGPDDRIEDLITPEEVEEVAANYRQIAGFLKKAG